MSINNFDLAALVVFAAFLYGLWTGRMLAPEWALVGVGFLITSELAGIRNALEEEGGGE